MVDRSVVFKSIMLTQKEINMTNRFCLTQDVTSKIYRLADASEDIIAMDQTTLLVKPGTEFRLHHAKPLEELTVSPLVESKTLVTGLISLKLLLKEGDVVELNQHNFNKTDFPVRNFTDRFLLKKEKGSKDLVRVYSTEGLHAKNTLFTTNAIPTLARDAATRFFEHLVGKENLISQVSPTAKLTIQLRGQKAVVGSLYHSVLYRFKDFGDCEALSTKAVRNITPEDIVIRYSFSKNTVFIYLGDNPTYVGEEFLKNLESMGQEDFYIKPETKPTILTYGYVEPVIKLK